MKKKIGVWTIDFPATINGRVASRTAFVTGTYASDFVSLDGNGRIGVGDGVRACLSNKKVTRYLVNLSLNIEA